MTLQSIGDAVICTDAANRVTFMNPVAEKLTGVAGGEALGKTLDHVYWAVDEETGAEDRRGAAGDRRLRQRCRPEQPRRAHPARRHAMQHPSGRVADHERARRVLRMVIVFQDFTDARALQRQLAHAAAHDALTGLANRSSFIRTMEDLVDQARKAATGRPRRRISSCSSTSTISSWSTTPAVTPRATPCSSGLPTRSGRRSARTTSSPGSAATNSRSS